MPGLVRVVIPVFDDWESLELLLAEIDVVVGKSQLELQVLVVDDGSTQLCSALWTPPKHCRAPELLRLRRNLGHQRAIAVALAALASDVDRAQDAECEAVIVMDGDGEDSPDDIPRLVERLRARAGAEIVFAERTRRAEGLPFRMFYGLFRLAHRLLTGRGVRFGNFSAIPAALLPAFLVLSETWNHYAAAVVRARLPYGTLRTARRRRLRGKSKMNFVSLVAHGLSAVSVFGDVVATRALIAAVTLLGVGALGIAAALWIRFFTELAIPGWTTNVIAFALILMAQAVTACFVLSIFTLQSRSAMGFLPCRDYAAFIAKRSPLVRDESALAREPEPRAQPAVPA